MTYEDICEYLESKGGDVEAGNDNERVYSFYCAPKLEELAKDLGMTIAADFLLESKDRSSVMYFYLTDDKISVGRINNKAP